jgi:hypothetical protein
VLCRRIKSPHKTRETGLIVITFFKNRNSYPSLPGISSNSTPVLTIVPLTGGCKNLEFIDKTDANSGTLPIYPNKPSALKCPFRASSIVQVTIGSMYTRDTPLRHRYFVSGIVHFHGTSITDIFASSQSRASMNNSRLYFAPRLPGRICAA